MEAEFYEDDQNNVRVIRSTDSGHVESAGLKGGDANLPPLAPHPNWDEVEIAPPLDNEGMYVEDLLAGIIEEAPRSTTPGIIEEAPRPTTPPDRPISPEMEIRQAHINDAAELAYTAAETFRKAVDTIGIVDLVTKSKYAALVMKLVSAAEEFEKKL